MATQHVVAPPAKAGMFLVLTVKDGSEQAVRDLLPDVSGFTRSVGFRDSDEYLICNIGIGSDLWDRMYDFPRPKGLHPFQEIKGETHTAMVALMLAIAANIERFEPHKDGEWQVLHALKGIRNGFLNALSHGV